MKKYISLLIIILFSFSFSFSQNNTAKKGNKYYNIYHYYDAIEKLEQITDKTPEIKRQLAESYFNTGQYEEAQDYYFQLSNSNDATKDDIYDLVRLFLINEKYQEAELWMNKFSQIAPDDTRAKLFASSKGFYKSLSKDKGFFLVKNLDYNNDAQEFSTTFYKDKILYSTSRKDVEIIKRKWAWNELPFLDLYIAEIDTNTLEFTSYEKFSFNKKFHEGTVSFNKEYDFMFFTSNNYKHPSSDKIIKLKMMSSRLRNNGKWSKPKNFPYNDKEYSVGHPALTPDGKTVYFASDQPGGIGGVDIYVSHLNDNGSWSIPQNLGDKINTESNEMFPFIHPKGFLFFASNGRPGLGGLDIFVAKIEQDQIVSVENLGAPVNTNFDDFGFIIDEKLEYGYFSSNRLTGKGDDDIYSFKLKKPYFIKKTIVGIAVDQNNEPLKNVTVNLYDDNNNIIRTITTDSTGKFEFIVEPNKEFVVDGNKDKYAGDTNNISSKTPDPIIYTKLVLTRLEFSLVGLIADDLTKKPIDSAVVLLKRAKTTIKTNFISDSIGKFDKELPDVKLNDVITYLVKVSKDGYFPVEDSIEIVFDHPGVYYLDEYLKTDLHKINVGEDIGKLVDVNPIYFDLDKYNIRPDAAIELDKIVKVMNDNPTLVIELGSHTDSRASYYYNDKLSNHRAVSSAQYIKSRISNPSRIYGKGYGERKHLIIDAETNAKYPFLPIGQELNDTFIYSLPTKEEQEIAHQLNRRTEFTIIKH